MFFHHVQEIDNPAACDGYSDHTYSEGSVDNKNTCECELLMLPHNAQLPNICSYHQSAYTGARLALIIL